MAGDGQRVGSLGRSPGRPSRRELEREERLAQVAEQIANGELTIRQATAADLTRLEAARQRRDQAGAPIRKAPGEHWA